MARTKNNERSASRTPVDVGATGTNPVPKGAVAILAVSVIAAVWAVAMMTAPGRVGYYYFFIYAKFYMGVVALVSLSITIMIGLVATDRMVLSIRQRVFLQSAHRTTGVIAVAGLFVHVWTNIVEKNISLIDVAIPFLVPLNRVAIGLGTLSGWVMVLVLWTGLARTRFIGKGRPWMWRGIHAISYLMWPIALVHGLSAGRPAATWVIVSYVVCVLGVVIGLAVRLSVSLNRRKDFASTAASGGLKPPGSLVPTSAPGVKGADRRGKSRVEEVGPAAKVDSFKPAAPAQTLPPLEEPAAAPPVPPAGMPVLAADGPAPRQRRGDAFDEPTGAIAQRALDFDDDRRPPRGRRAEMSDTGTRMRRDDFEDTGSRMRRDDFESTGSRMRREDFEDTGAMRRAELEDTSTRRRRSEPRREDFEDTGAMRRAELEDTSTRRRRSEPRREDFEDTGAMRRAELEDTSTRRRRSEPRRDDVDDTSARMRRGDLEDTSTRMRRSEMFDDGPAPRQRRYADDEPEPRARRRAADDRYEDAPRSRRRADEYDDAARPRSSRYADDEPPRRSASRYGGEDTEALRVPRDGMQEPERVQAGRGARRGGRGRAEDETADDGYWSQLRGEAN